MRHTAAGLIWAATLSSEPSPELRTERLGEADGWRLESRCSPEACSPVLVSPIAGQPERTLPTAADDPPWAIDGISLHALKMVDLDGDGQAELRVDWRSSGIPRAALGSWHRDFTTVVDIRTGQLRLHVETGAFGGASETHCAGTLSFTATGASLDQQCQLRACVVGGARAGECEAGPQKRTRTISWMR